jgi:polysaccharide pyruvyl transferase WcaK-like protein
MRVLIRGGGLINKGAEAMLLTAKVELGARLATASFVLPFDCIRHDSEQTQAHAYGFAVKPLREESAFASTSRLTHAALFSRYKARDLLRRRSEHLETLNMLMDVDAVVDVHGYAFGDPWGEHYATRTDLFVEHCRAHGKPYVFLPQSWGPFQRKSTLGRYRAICSGATGLFARDKASRAYVGELLGRPAEAIALSPDIAFRFRPAQNAEAAPLFAALGIEERVGALVGIAPNMRVFERAIGEGSENAYMRALVNIARLFLAEGVRVVLIPHEIKARQSATERDDDRFLISRVAEELADARVIPMVGNYTAPQIKAVIGQLDLLIGSRFHALVGALSSGVPVVALGWSHKYDELLDDVGLRGYCTGYDELHWEQVRPKVLSAWKVREGLRGILDARLPAIQSQVDECFDEVAQMLVH